MVIIYYDLVFTCLIIQISNHITDVMTYQIQIWSIRPELMVAYGR